MYFVGFEFSRVRQSIANLSKNGAKILQQKVLMGDRIAAPEYYIWPFV